MVAQSVMDEAKKWLDWAYGCISEKRWDDATWNLAQFQAVYARAYPSASDSQRAELLAWNSRAATALSLVSGREAGAASSAWYAPFFPGDTLAKIERAGAASAAAAEAAVISGRMAQAAGSSDSLALKQAVIQRVEADAESKAYTQEAPNAYADFFNQEWLGVPVWGWAAGGALLLILWKR